jgi:4-diphosphocytidyl-2-C-methyl-D-erythritol kinase
VSAPALALQTPAKINWVLEALGKRNDGFHELALVFQAISLWDELSFYPKDRGLELSIESSPAPLEADDSNLVLKAAKLFFQAAGFEAGIRIELKKNIPLAAGLGGGSSDAAATLWGLNHLYKTRMPLEKLQALASRLGSDVPFFLTGGTALGLGRGEIIEPWEPAVDFSLVLVKPEEGLATPKVYQSGMAVFTQGEKARELKPLLQTKDPGAVARGLFNGLEPAAFSLLARVQSLKNSLLEEGALGALVSGSGPTVFALVDNEKAAQALAKKMKPQAAYVFAVQTVSEGPRIIS